MADRQMDAEIVVQFDEAASRQSLNSGDNLPTLFSKVKKFFSDLKTVAFSGSYNDLSDKPEIPTITVDTELSDTSENTVQNKIIANALKNVDAKTVNGLTVETGVPANAVFSDTVYDDTAVKAHIADTNVHITADERTKWNAKSDFSGSYSDLSNAPTSLPANGGNADTVNGHTVESDVPADAKFTDTVYDDAELVTKIGILETSLNGHTVKADVPENAEFTDTVYTHPTTSGNKHIPSGGSSGQILRWASDGIAYWGNDVDTTYSTFGKSGPDASLGLVPKPPTTPGYSKYLREDCTWAEADEELNSSSKNPIQNQAVYFEIFGLNARLKSHTHKVEDIYDIGFSSEEVVKAIEWVIHLDETPEYVKESVAKANEVHYVSGRIGYTVGTESAKIELGFVPTAIWVSNISTGKNVINISRTNDVNTYFTVPAKVSGLVTGTLCYVAFK